MNYRGYVLEVREDGNSHDIMFDGEWIATVGTLEEATATIDYWLNAP